MSKKFTIRGKTYDLADAADLVSIQNALVPDNWPGKKSDCVRLFLALQEMLALQIRRHFAANFKQLAKSAIEEAEDGGSARIGSTFAFEIDLTSPLVAALTKLKMSFSVKHGTEGKPQTFDLTQGELPLDGDDMSQVLNPRSLTDEGKKEEKGDGASVEKFPGGENPDPDAGGDVTAENTPGDAATAPKRGRGRPKKGD